MRKPLATYRLQLHSGFGFDAAAAIADYLSALGVSHVYSSPYLQAMPGSNHGYDVADHHHVNLELGGVEAHARFGLRLGTAGLGQVLDIVPNHMAIGGRWNLWWWDVLENGLASPYASYFDIDWQSPDERFRNKVLLPVLGNHYGRVLKNHEIRLVRNGPELTAHYYEHELPIAPESVAPLLAAAANRASSDRTGAEALGFLADSLMRLPVSESADRATLVGRHRDKEVIRRWLDRVFNERAEIAQAVDAEIAAVNEDVNALDRVLDRQNYRLAYWKAASRDLGYRRFFDINSLVGLHMEHEHVFADTHSLVLDWLREGVLDGVRVDHPDGLRDPRQYFERLRRAAPDVWIVVEKILARGEKLRGEWPVEGTTGYDFLNMVLGLYVDRRSEQALTRFYHEFTGNAAPFGEVAYEKKSLVLRDVLGSDVNRLTAMFQEICERNRDHRDYSAHEIRHAIRTMVAEFPVYRTYVRAESGEIVPVDREHIEQAASAAKKRRQDLDGELFDFLRDVLSLEVTGSLESAFVMQFQQFTGTAMAKGVEDTAFYSYNRLVALNEVGGNPGCFGIRLNEFHRYCAERHLRWPRTQLASSTHDTKRSEDVRARMTVISEMPSEWRKAVETWSAHNERHKRNRLPDRNAEYLLYQTIVGAWPISTERLSAYMLKACRENKEYTTWTEPNSDYENALSGFIDGVCADPAFLRGLEAFLHKVIWPGRVNSIAQTLIRMTAPGVPDIYQGTEIWDLSLVDPDNRRPVDFELRIKFLSELGSLDVEQIMARMDDGLPKLWAIRQALDTRRRYMECFGPQGTYRPVHAKGPGADRIVSFRRGEDIMLIVPRFLYRARMWGDTTIEIPPGSWTNVLAGVTLEGGAASVDDLFKKFPSALLTRTAALTQ
ncbi:MAG: malto-oligosyltrehalose synthase [Terriglobia bacterium]